MNYYEVINYIGMIERFGSRPGLKRLQSLLKHLGNPEEKLSVIHVGGTNGKGSVCSMISYILVSAGYNVGTYISPHLEHYNERIKMNNKDISDEDFASIGEEIIYAAKKCEAENGEHPTVFECLTGMALLYFAKKRVEFVILEVGLGGRFDATNIIKNPLISVITSIGMDHMDVLGDNLESIAYEKTGIIKKNSNVVLYFPNNQVYNIIKDVCDDLNASLSYNSNINLQDIRHSIEGTSFSIDSDYYSYRYLELSLIGEHQIYNTALVLTVVEVLKDKGVSISEKNVRIGLKECHWPGRMEIVGKNPLILLDGAHNEEGAAVLAKAFKQYFSNKNITLLLGVLQDKPYENMLRQLLPHVKRVVLTEPNSNRKLSIGELEHTIRQQSSVPIFKDNRIKHAFEIAMKLTNPNDLLCCAGSLYLIGEIKTILNKRG